MAGLRVKRFIHWRAARTNSVLYTTVNYQLTRELEALDRKYNRTHTIEDARRIGEKSAETLSDDDLVVLESFDPVGGPAKRAQRDQARGPIIRKDRVRRRRSTQRTMQAITIDEVGEAMIELVRPLIERIERLERSRR